MHYQKVSWKDNFLQNAQLYNVFIIAGANATDARVYTASEKLSTPTYISVFNQ